MTKIRYYILLKKYLSLLIISCDKLPMHQVMLLKVLIKWICSEGDLYKGNINRFLIIVTSLFRNIGKDRILIFVGHTPSLHILLYHRGVQERGSDLGCWDFSILDFRKTGIFRKGPKWAETREFWGYIQTPWYLCIF